MPSTQTLLSALLAASVAVNALPYEEKRALGDEVTATIDGQVVSWQNDWSGEAAATSVPASVVNSVQTTAATPAPTAAASTTGNYITATIDGVVVSWINNWPPPTSTGAAATPTSASFCKDVHLFLAKGNNEPYPGRQGALADAVCSGLPSCDYENIMYYNPVGYDYCAGVTEGDTNGHNQIVAYAQSCPNAKLVLSGYSQGTNVIGDILGGGGGSFGVQKCIIGDSPALSPTTSPGNQIAAVTLFGNTRHVANQTYNVLNGSAYDTDNPRYPDQLARMNMFSSMIRDYCDETDPVCALEGPGPFVIENHLNYFDRYTNDAAAWIQGKLSA